MKECYKIKIEPLTAVHIGTGERLLPIDYVLKAPENSERKNYVKFSSERIIDSILKSGSPKQKQELQRVSDENNINSLASFFQKYFYLGIDYDSRITNGFLNLHSQKIKSGLFENSLAVNQMLHHGAKPYIPGSSIKGMLRMGIIFHLLENSPGMKEKFHREMYKALQSDNPKKTLGNLSKTIEEALLEYKDDKKNVHKCLAGLQVGDALAEAGTVPESVILQRTYGITCGGRKKEFEKPLDVFWECIPAGSEFRLRISMDKAMLQKIGISSIEEIFGYCRLFMQRGLKLQEKVFGRRYGALFDEAQEADCFLGAGTGFLQKSLWFSLFADEAEAMKELRGFLDQSFRQHSHRVLDKAISPRTIKLVGSGRRKQMMGLCKLEVIS